MQHLFVVFTIPRILVVDVDAPYLRMGFVSAHAPITRQYEARAAFFKLLGKYVTCQYPVTLFIDANARLEESIGTAKSGSNAYLRDAALQFSDFLDLHEFATIHSIPRFAAATTGTWT